MHEVSLVADGHLGDVILSSVYSGVVSLRGIMLVLFFAERNGPKSWINDMRPTFLESLTKEKVHAVARPECVSLEGHSLIIIKALHGLQTSGLNWYERLADFFRDLELESCKIKPDI